MNVESVHDPAAAVTFHLHGVSNARMEYQMEYHRNNKANGQEGPSSLAVGEGYTVQLYNVNNMLYMGRMLPISRVPDLPRRAGP